MREVISTKDAPQAIGPYSQASGPNGFVFVSGQNSNRPRDPADRFKAMQPHNRGAVTDQSLRDLEGSRQRAGESGPVDRVSQEYERLRCDE